MFVLTRAVEGWIRLLGADPAGEGSRRAGGSRADAVRVSFWDLDVSLWRVATLLAAVLVALAPLLVLVLLLTRMAPA